jgi:hypothetical protein
MIEPALPDRGNDFVEFSERSMPVTSAPSAPEIGRI